MNDDSYRDQSLSPLRFFGAKQKTCKRCGKATTSTTEYCSTRCDELAELEESRDRLKARAEFAEIEAERLRVENSDLMSRFDHEVQQETERLRAALTNAAAEISLLRAVLEAVEWVMHSLWGSICPWCRKPESKGHAPDCPRQRALGVAP